MKLRTDGDKRVQRLVREVLLAAPILLLSVSMFGCFAPQKGSVLISASPNTAADDLVYFADAAGKIHALRSDGQAQWRYSLTEDLRARGENSFGEIRIDRLFARSDKKLYVLARIETGDKVGNMILYALDGGKLMWFKDVPRPEPDGTPVVIGDKALYLAGNDGDLYAFAREDGRLLWRYQVSPGRIGPPSLGADGMIYVTGPRHNLHAVDVDGNQRWTFETNPQ